MLMALRIPVAYEAHCRGAHRCSHTGHWRKWAQDSLGALPVLQAGKGVSLHLKQWALSSEKSVQSCTILVMLACEMEVDE